jgi:hypothetical protein
MEPVMLVILTTLALTIQRPRFPILVFDQNFVEMQDFGCSWQLWHLNM